MKNAICEAVFPELRVPIASKTGRGQGGSVIIAAQRALKAAMKQVKGKRITVVRCNLTIVEATEPTEGV